MKVQTLAILAAVGGVLAIGSMAHAAVFTDVNLGEAGPNGLNLTVFNLSGTYSQSGGSTLISGNLGLAGSGGTNVSGDSPLTGNVYKGSSVTLQGNFSQQIAVSGSIITDNTHITQAVSNVDTAATTAASLTANQTFSGNLPQGTTINPTVSAGTLNALGGHDTVVSIGSIDEGNGNITFTGGANDYYIVNVLGDVNISNTGIIASQTGGNSLPANHILFNIEGGDITVTGGGTDEIDGTFLDANHNATIHDKVFTGGLFANNITITSNPTLDGTAFNPVPEPASLSLLGLGAVGLLARRRRA